jgi:hypothetical protein
MIRYTNKKVDPQALDVRLNVSVSGLKVEVKKGEFRINGKTYRLADDYEHDVSLSDTFDTFVEGFLVTDKNGKAMVLIDEVVYDGVDIHYNFKDGMYRPLQPLFYINKIPPGTTDLAGLEMVVERTVRA